jgi:hypothetical protein
MTRFKIRHDFFPRDVFETLKSNLVDSKLASVLNGLDEDNFGELAIIIV